MRETEGIITFSARPADRVQMDRNRGGKQEAGCIGSTQTGLRPDQTMVNSKLSVRYRSVIASPMVLLSGLVR